MNRARLDNVEVIRDAITFGMGWAQSEGAVDDSTERDEALAALDALVDALAFYSDPMNYENATPRHVRPVVSDRGAVARAALGYVRKWYA